MPIHYHIFLIFNLFINYEAMVDVFELNKTFFFPNQKIHSFYAVILINIFMFLLIHGKNHLYF